jgi:asparagine synthase (glutamine-hydrolysing)
MGVIFGYISRSGKPVEKTTVETMKMALEFTCPDKTFEWSDNTLFLGYYHKFNTPESVNEVYPMTDPTGNIIFMASCRIDNRDELNNLLHIPFPNRQNITDGELMFQSYLKWGEEACDRMLGDWSYLAWHKNEEKLIVSRDHCGITALYYTILPDAFIFSSSPKAILKLGFVPKTINELRIAQILTAWPGNGEDTCYEGIFNLLPGHYLKFENNELHKIKFWELTEQEDLVLPKEQDYYDRFLEIFTESVKCRLRTTKNVGISLSGGLDSTSIAAVAAIELAKQNKELFAFTSVPYYKDYKVPKGRNGDEGELAGLMAKMYPNIRHFLVDAGGYSPIEAIKKGVEIYDEPMHAAANQYWMQAINIKANENGVLNLLIGQGGNGVVSWPVIKIRNNSQKGYNYYKHKLKIFLQNVNEEKLISPFLKYSDISPKFAEKLDLINKMKANNHDPKFYQIISFKQEQIKLISQTSKNAYGLYFRSNLNDGLNALDPTGDKKLREFSCALPIKLFSDNQYDHILVKKGLKNMLPIEVLTSTKKGCQAVDFKERIQTDSEMIIQILKQAINNYYITSILDLQKIEYNASLFSKPTILKELNYSSTLPKSISVIIFISNTINY